MIKSIPTKYKGIQMRSKLETDWAKLFDKMGLPWEYEKAAYVLDSGCYLPDFWFPTLQMWGEVKPFKALPIEVMKLKELVAKTGYPGMFFEGSPRTGVVPCFRVSGDMQNDELYKGVEPVPYKFHRAAKGLTDTETPCTVEFQAKRSWLKKKA